MNRAIAAVLDQPPPESLAASLAALPDAVEEIRVALAAGYDTTAHTLAWAAWHLAGAPRWRSPDHLPQFLDEVLRLYPAGWIGSRVCARDVEVPGAELRAGTLILYSPFLTHRDATLWPNPDDFDPDRFDDGRPAWGYLPFSAGRRTCLGATLARAMLRAALTPCLDGMLTQVDGDPTPRATLTLRPIGPLRLDRVPPGESTTRWTRCSPTTPASIPGTAATRHSERSDRPFRTGEHVAGGGGAV
jgi:cytochrome P450